MWSSDEYRGRQQRIVNNNLSDIKGPDSGTGGSPQRAKDKINSGYVKAHISPPRAPPSYSCKSSEWILRLCCCVSSDICLIFAANNFLPPGDNTGLSDDNAPSYPYQTIKRHNFLNCKKKPYCSLCVSRMCHRFKKAFLYMETVISRKRLGSPLYAVQFMLYEVTMTCL